MATKNQNPDTAKGATEPDVTKQPELLEIGELRTKCKVGKAIFAGVCAANDWRPGKRISEDDFAQAVAAFTGTPTDGRSHNESEAKR